MRYVWSFETKPLLLALALSASGGCVAEFNQPASDTIAPPTVTAVSPDGVGTWGSIPIHVTGTGFWSGVNVFVGGAPCKNVSVTASTALDCTPPAHAAGTVDVRVVNPDLQAATLASSFTYAIDRFSRLDLLAGSRAVEGFSDGASTAARFNNPAGVTTDGTDLYVADWGNSVIRKITVATGATSTLAGAPGQSGSTDATGSLARFDHPYGIASDGTNLFVADNGNHTIRKIVIATGVTTTLAGLAGSPGTADGTGAPAGTARFNFPYGVTTDTVSVYVSDSGSHTIRKLDATTGATVTLSGAAGVPNTNDGTGGGGGTARFSSPQGLTNDGTYLYLADSGNHAIRKITIADGTVVTLAGLPGTPGALISNNGSGNSARFNFPSDVTTDGTYLYVADQYNYRIRKVALSSGNTTNLAGGASAGSTNSTDQSGATARFYFPTGIARVGANLYVTNNTDCTVRKVIISSGETTTHAGAPGGRLGAFGFADATSGADALFGGPISLVQQGASLLALEYSNHVVREIDSVSGAASTVAGLGGTAGTVDSSDATGATARFASGLAMASDGTSLYVADTTSHTIRKVTISTGNTITLSGAAGAAGSADGSGLGGTARFSSPSGITFDGVYLYVSDTDNHTIRKVDPASGDATTLSGSAGVAGGANGTGGGGGTARFSSPRGLANDGNYLYVADGDAAIRKVAITNGDTTTLAGVSGTPGYVDGNAGSARFRAPHALTSDGVSLYVTDYGNQAVRKVSLATGQTSTVAGQARRGQDVDGALGGATLFNPDGIVYDSARGLFVGNGYNIRRLR